MPISVLWPVTVVSSTVTAGHREGKGKKRALVPRDSPPQDEVERVKPVRYESQGIQFLGQKVQFSAGNTGPAIFTFQFSSLTKLRL